MPAWILRLDLSKAFDRVDCICSKFFKTCISMNVERSPDTDGTAALFKSMQARDKDACLVRCCFVRYFIFPLIGQCQRGEHGRMVVRLDLIFMMACHHFWFLSGADDILIFPTFSHEIIRLPFLPSVLLAIEQSG